MSLASTRVGFQYRAYLERDANADTRNSWGSPNDPDWETITEDPGIPCSAWTSSGSEATTQDRTIVAERRGISVPVGTDVTELDRVVRVEEESSGDTYWTGPMEITSAIRYPDHIELSGGR